MFSNLSNQGDIDKLLYRIKKLGDIKKLNKKQKEIKKLIEDNREIFRQLYHWFNNPLVYVPKYRKQNNINNLVLDKIAADTYNILKKYITLAQYNKYCAKDDIVPVIKPMLCVSIDEINPLHINNTFFETHKYTVCYLTKNLKKRFFIVVTDLKSCYNDDYIIIKNGTIHILNDTQSTIVHDFLYNLSHTTYPIDDLILDVYCENGGIYVIDVLPLDYFSGKAEESNKTFTSLRLVNRIFLLSFLGGLADLYIERPCDKVILKHDDSLYRSGKCWTWLEMSREEFDRRYINDRTNEL